MNQRPSRRHSFSGDAFRLGFILLTLLTKGSPNAISGEPPLIDIKTFSPRIKIEMRYATTNNFTHQKLYPIEQCLLSEPAAIKLDRVQKRLEKQGLGLKVWDCYRPVSIQQKLWDTVPDDRFVANPKFGSRHNRGMSVDLTLVDSNGNELPMPTGFDEFSEKAHRSYHELPEEILKNRQTLQDAMEAEGFVGLATEWWHFDDPDWRNYALRDEPLGSTTLTEDRKHEATQFQINNEIKQLILVIGSHWNSSKGTLARYERTADGWKKIGETWPVILGKNGMGWGVGFQPDVKSTQVKVEGDLKSPAGVFKVGAGFGRADQKPEGSAWSYQKITDQLLCIDDANSYYYNKIVTNAVPVKQDWKHCETMKRPDHLYNWVINIEQNFPVIKKKCGSCIFFHVWRNENAFTEGCTAMKEEHMIELFKWLQPKSYPFVVQLPQEEYETLKQTWKLP